MWPARPLLGSGMLAAAGIDKPVAHDGAPDRISERLLARQAQTVAQYDPAGVLDKVDLDQPSSGDYRQQRLTAAEMSQAMVSPTAIAAEWPGRHQQQSLESPKHHFPGRRYWPARVQIDGAP